MHIILHLIALFFATILSSLHASDMTEINASLYEYNNITRITLQSPEEIEIPVQDLMQEDDAIYIKLSEKITLKYDITQSSSNILSSINLLPHHKDIMIVLKTKNFNAKANKIHNVFHIDITKDEIRIKNNMVHPTKKPSAKNINEEIPEEIADHIIIKKENEDDKLAMFEIDDKVLLFHGTKQIDVLNAQKTFKNMHKTAKNDEKVTQFDKRNGQKYTISNQNDHWKVEIKDENMDNNLHPMKINMKKKYTEIQNITSQAIDFTDSLGRKFKVFLTEDIYCNKKYKTPFYTIHPSHLGIVIEVHSDNINVIEQERNVRIINELRTKSQKNYNSLYPINRWLSANKLYTEGYQRNLRNVAESEDPEIKLNMVKFYIAHGMYKDANHYLLRLKNDYKSIVYSRHYHAFAALTNYMLDDYEKAYNHIKILKTILEDDDDEVDYEQEILLWETVMRYKLKKDHHTLDYGKYKDFVEHYYSQDVIKKIKMDIVDLMIGKNNIEEAHEILKSSKHKESHEAKLRKAKIYEALDMKEKAEKLYKKVSNECTNNAIKLQAEYAMIKPDIESDAFSLQYKINALEKIRYISRYNALEEKILWKLGDLYKKDEQYIESIDVYRELINYYPKSNNALIYMHDMHKAFADAFADEKYIQNIDQIKLITLCMQNMHMIPAGDIGFEISKKIIEIMMNAELLSQSAAFGEYAIESKISDQKHVEYMQVKLGEIHLANNNYKRVIEVLSPMESDDVMIDRMLAKAHIKNDEHEKAMRHIEKLDASEGDDFRSEIFLKTHDWDNLKGLLEAKLEFRENPDAPLSHSEKRYIRRLSIAYAANNDHDSLSKINKNFAMLMKGDEGLKSHLKYLMNKQTDHEVNDFIAENLS